MADFKVNHITGKQGQQGTVLAGVTTVSSTGAMRFPSGPTEQRGGRGRGIIGGGSDIPSSTGANILNFVTIATLGNGTDWGDLSYGNAYRGGLASSTRGVFVNGQNDQTTDYVTISSQGGASDFGEITSEYMGGATLSNDILGYRCGGSDGGVQISTIVGMRIAQTGSFYDFGDMTTTGTYMSGLSSPTRGIISGGYFPVPAADAQNVIQYITIQSTGNAQEFGDLTLARKYIDTSCSATRGINAGGGMIASPNRSDTIDYITIASTGNAVDFGNLLAGSDTGKSGVVSNSTRGLFAGEYPTSARIQYITIATTGDAADFGDLTYHGYGCAGCSDSHGGIGD